MKWIKKKNFMAPFYGWGSTTSRLEPLRAGSLLFTANPFYGSVPFLYLLRTSEKKVSETSVMKWVNVLNVVLDLSSVNNEDTTVLL